MRVRSGHCMLLQLLQEAHQQALLCRLETAIPEDICSGGRHLPVLAIPPHIAAGQDCISHHTHHRNPARHSH